MRKLRNTVILLVIGFVCLISSNSTYAKNSDKLRFLDVKLDDLSYLREPYNKKAATQEKALVNLVSGDYEKRPPTNRYGIFLGGFEMVSYHDAKLRDKLKSDFSIASVPSKKTKHKFFDFSKVKTLTTDDFKFYTRLFKWHPVGKLTPYKTFADQIYFIDESGNFRYVALVHIDRKSKKLVVESFFSVSYPTTPYIFFAGYMGYPDIPEASPDYK